ncbi:MAG: hypothetical protein ABGY95_12750, partial [Rubritalea sp.]|uniref:hypothetical protein n=1 Tax=Rubritalea sp. TaxID=2109375 RepID=UPI003242AD28
GSVHYFEHTSRNGVLYLAPESLPPLTSEQLHTIALELDALEDKVAKGRARYAAYAVQESIWDSETNHTHS